MLVLSFDSKTKVQAATQVLIIGLNFLNLLSLTLILSLKPLFLPRKVMAIFHKTVFIFLALKVPFMGFLELEFKLFDFNAELSSF